jgi:hypothetical protein
MGCADTLPHSGRSRRCSKADEGKATALPAVNHKERKDPQTPIWSLRLRLLCR